jgi:hypothetical protein
MTLAVLQPGYLPDFSFFAMLAAADVVLLADDLQYSTRSNLNRTRIKTANGAHWLSVPVLSRRRLGQTIVAVEIDNHREWRTRHWRTLVVNYGPAPYWDRYERALQELYARSWTHLLALNQALIAMMAEELGVAAPAGLTSQVPTRPGRSDKVVYLLRAWGCDIYLVLRREQHLVDGDTLAQQGLSLRPVDVVEPVYHQLFGTFVPGLSVLDLLMNEGPAAVRLLRGCAQVAP